MKADALPMESIRQTIKKLREFRINDYAIFDFAVSYLAAYLLSFPLKHYFTLKQLFYLVIPVAIIAHTIFRVHTPLTDRFWNPNGDYLIKLTAVFMLFRGLNINPVAKISALYSK